MESLAQPVERHPDGDDGHIQRLPDLRIRGRSVIPPKMGLERVEQFLPPARSKLAPQAFQYVFQEGSGTLPFIEAIRRKFVRRLARVAFVRRLQFEGDHFKEAAPFLGPGVAMLSADKVFE